MRPQLRKHRQLKTVTLRAIMLTGSIKPGDSRKPGCSIWIESGFVGYYGRHSVHSKQCPGGPVGIVTCFFPLNHKRQNSI